MKNDFLAIRFPDDISYGSLAGPVFNTDINISHSGIEYRNINWETPRLRFMVTYESKTKEQISRLLSFFRISMGKAMGFRFKDWSDYEANEEALDALDGLKTEFALQKKYIFGTSQSIRRIIKPVPNTVDVWAENSSNEKISIDYTVDYDNGIVHLKSPLGDGLQLKANFEFDIPARFDVDSLSISLDSNSLMSCDNIKIIEIII